MTLKKGFFAGHFLLYLLVALFLSAAALGAAYYSGGDHEPGLTAENLSNSMGGNIQEPSSTRTPGPVASQPTGGDQQPASASSSEETAPSDAETQTDYLAWSSEDYPDNPSDSPSTPAPAPPAENPDHSYLSPATATAYGQATQTGQPLAQHRVKAVPIIVYGEDYPGIQSTTTGADGAYALTLLAEGLYQICVEGPGLDGKGVSHCSPDIQFAPEDNQQVNLVVPDKDQLAYITGTVRNAAGEPLASQTVFAGFPYPTLLPVPGFTTATDDQGRYRFGLEAGAYQICVSDDNRYSCHGEILELQAGDDLEGIDIVILSKAADLKEISGTRVSGTAYHAGGKPLGDQLVYARSADETEPQTDESGPDPGASLPSTFSDAEGRYSLGGLLSGFAYLICTQTEAEDGSTSEYCHEKPVTLDEGERRDYIDIIVGELAAAAYTLNGTIYSPTGEPLAAMPVTAQPLAGPDEAVIAMVFETVSDDAGRYYFDLGPGSYQLCAGSDSAAACYPEAVVISEGGQYYGYDIYLNQSVAEGKISGQVLTPEGVPLPEQIVFARATGAAEGEKLPSTISDGQGFYVLLLKPGTYDLCTWASGPDGSPSEYCHEGSITLNQGDSLGGVDILAPISPPAGEEPPAPEGKPAEPEFAWSVPASETPALAAATSSPAPYQDSATTQPEQAPIDEPAGSAVSAPAAEDLPPSPGSTIPDQEPTATATMPTPVALPQSTPSPVSGSATIDQSPPPADP